VSHRIGRTLVAATVGAAFLAGGAVLAASAQAVPSLVSFSSVCPYERVGSSEAPVAVLGLDTPAVADTSISVVVSEPLVASVPGGQVTIPTGQQTAPVPVTAMNAGDVTLFATLETTTLQQPLKVGPIDQVPELPTVSLTPDAVSAGESSTATVLLDFLAPPGGTTLTLASDNPEVDVSAQLVIPADQCSGSFTVSSTSAATGSADISATLGSNVGHAQLTVTRPNEEEPTQPPSNTESIEPLASLTQILPGAAPGPTGRRAAALRRCNRKFRHDKAKRARCKKKARSLPV
jgi:hypothetical protein